MQSNIYLTMSSNSGPMEEGEKGRKKRTGREKKEGEREEERMDEI